MLTQSPSKSLAGSTTYVCCSLFDCFIHSDSSITQIVYCCWLAAETVFCFFFIVETKGRSLEETAAIFDGEEMVQKVAATAHDIREDHVYDDKGSDSYQLPEKTA